MNTFKQNEGYLRFRKQLIALKISDLKTVQKLAQEAKHQLDQKRTQNLLLPFTY